MRLSNEVLLALAYVSRISDPDLIKSRFIESLNGLDETLTFALALRPPPDTPEDCIFPIQTIHSSFGFALTTEISEIGADERAIFRNAFQFLAILLENRIQALEVKSKNESLLQEVKLEKSLVRTVLDILPVGVWITDKGGKIVMVNSTNKKIWQNNGELPEAKWPNTDKPIGPEDWGTAQATKVGETVTNQEIAIRSPNGTDSTILHSAATIRNDTGDIIGAVGVNQDITERKIVEDALAGERTFLSAVLDNIQEAIVVCDEKGRLVRFNEAARRLHGIPEEPIPADQWAEHYDLFQKDGRKMLTTDEIPLFRALQGERVQNEEIVVAPKHSRPRSLVCSGQTLRDEKGSAVGAVIAMHDITERKQAELALRESEEQYRLLVENANDAIFITQDGVIIFPNPKTTEITGYSTSELSKISFDKIIHPEDRELVVERHLRRLKGENPPANYSFRIINKAGNELWVQLNAALISWEDRPATINIVRDITEQIKLEERLRQSQKMEAIGNLAGGIAHEFNNVLGIILGNAELAMDDVPYWNTARESLKEIRKASFRAKDVIRQILSFARKTMTALKPIEINTVVKESLKLIRVSIPAMVDIQSNIPSGPSMILGDSTEIHQIVINLCTNAAHAMKASGGTLEVSISEVTLDEGTASRYEDLSPGDFVKLTVRDTGEGITPDVLEKAFEPYFTTKEFGAGSGMGLAVVYGIVKKCKGAIDIESTVGEGTNVTVLFPKIEEQAPSEEKNEDALPVGSERILLVDDDPSIVSMIRQMLERMGYTVTEMTDSISALDRFKSTPNDFDLVITDMAMPNMSGDQLAAKLINVRKEIPILLYTGHSDTIDEKKAKEIGIKGFAMKPLDKGKLARAVREALDGR